MAAVWSMDGSLVDRLKMERRRDMKDKVRHCNDCNLWGCPKRNYETDLCEYDMYEVTTTNKL